MDLTKYRTKIFTILLIVILSIVSYSPQSSFAAGDKVSNMIVTAKGLIGTPYKSGGTTPKGFDCSGFVNYVYKKQGVSLSRSSKEMWSKGGTKVSSLKPGDVVFFKTNGHSISHVGLYLGCGKFIHSASDGVRISGLSEVYYEKTFVGAKRFI